MNRRGISGIALLLLAFASAAQESEPIGPRTLQTLGLELEAARAAVGEDSEQQLLALQSALGELRDENDDHAKASRNQLSGEILFALGRYDEANGKFKEAREKFEQKAYQDDAEFWRVLTLEADRRDADANKAWNEWVKHYGAESPLRGEACLLRLWNALRRDDLKQGRELLAFAQRNAPWILEDPRWLNAEAVLELRAGDAKLALAALDRGAQGPDATYVRALALMAEGNSLKAAGFFQEASQRHPSPVVRDFAMLAKANIFLQSKVYKSAVEEFQLVLDRAEHPTVRAEAALRHAAAVFMDGDLQSAEQLLRGVATKHSDSDVGARAQFLLGETMVAQGRFEDAIVELNTILTLHFQQSVAASAQYRIGRCLDALNRPHDATGAYQAVVAGYPLEPEAPAAAYLAGAGLLAQGDFLGAAPYFQIVVDRYTTRKDADGAIVFATPEHQDLTEAALCLLALSYHRAGRLGQLSGAVHLMLTQMPDSRSAWRAWTVLIDADALAAQGRHAESQAQLEKLFAAFPEHPAVVPGNQLLAWSYAQQGEDEQAIAIEERMLRRYATSGSTEQLATARLNIGHVRFNQRRYQDAASEYEAYLKIEQDPAQQLLPLYQLGLCYQRLGRTGDSVDRWERLVNLQPSAPISEKAWARAGDVYFAAGHYEDASRCYQGLLQNFTGSAAAATGMLRLAQCSYNAGDDAIAIERYSELIERFPRGEEAVEARSGLELALYRLGQSASGVDALAQLVERYPGSSFAADAQFQIASQLYEAKDFVRAAEEFRRVVSQFPNSPNVDRAQLLAADSYAEAGQQDAAKSAYEQFTMLFGDSELIREARFRLGSMYFENEDYMRTALEFSQVLEGEKRDDLSKAALFNLGVCQKLLGDGEASLAAFARYREWFGEDERSLDIAIQTGQIHRAMQQPEAAKTEFARALEKGADGAARLEIQFELGSIHEELGDVDAALETYGRAMKSSDKSNPFRISAVARCAAIYEDKEQYSNALKAYRDLARNADDAELRAAAELRAKELEAFAR